jgi:hypothetical protein
VDDPNGHGPMTNGGSWGRALRATVVIIVASAARDGLYVQRAGAQALGGARAVNVLIGWRSRPG